MTEHRDAGWLAQLAEKDRQIQALQAAYEDTSAALMRALAALAEHDARYRQQVQDRAALHHKFVG
jgi:uncharacterized damage-inducible protein DinB